MLKGAGFFIFLVTGIILLILQQSYVGFAGFLLSMIAGTTMLFSPRLFRIEKFMRENNLNKTEAKKYAWHCSLVVIPQLFGIIRFYFGQLFNKPLKNKRSTLKTGLSTPGT